MRLSTTYTWMLLPFSFSAKCESCCSLLRLLPPTLPCYPASQLPQSIPIPVSSAFKWNVYGGCNSRSGVPWRSLKYSWSLSIMDIPSSQLIYCPLSHSLIFFNFLATLFYIPFPLASNASPSFPLSFHGPPCPEVPIHFRSDQLILINCSFHCP